MKITQKQVRSLFKTLEFEVSETHHHLRGCLVVDNIQVSLISISCKSREFPTPFTDILCRILNLKRDELEQLLNGDMSRNNYLTLLRIKGILNTDFSLEVIEEIRQLTPEVIQHLRANTDNLHRLHWIMFEQLIAELFASWGFQNVKLTGTRKDTAADVMAIQATDPPGVILRYFVEVKMWKEKIGVEVIDRVLGAMTFERPQWGWNVAFVITLAGLKNTVKYSEAQLQLMGIEVRDKTHIEKWLENYRPHHSGLWMPKA